MKNKKLFAILTLVCFMFTLMPVAAFAAVDASKAVNVYVEETAGNWTDDATVTAGTFNVKVATTTSGSVAVDAEDYVFYAVDEDGEGAAVALADATGKAALEILVAGDYKVYAAVAEGIDVASLLGGVDTVANKVAKVEAWAKSANKVVDEYAIVAVEAPEFAYQIVLTQNNSAKAGYVNSVVTGAFGSDAFDMDIEASNGFNKDGGVIATLYKAPLAAYKAAKTAGTLDTYKATTANWSVVKNQELTISEAGYVDVVCDELTTDSKGQIYFVVTSDLANSGNKVIVKFGNEAKATLTVDATNNQVANVALEEAPKAPHNNENPIVAANVEFKFTDKNGVAVTLGTTAGVVTDSDVAITVVEKPAKSNLKDSDLQLVKQNLGDPGVTADRADGAGVYTLSTKVAGEKFDKDGTYVIKVALKNGDAAEATVKVAEMGDVVRIMFKEAPKTVAYGKTVNVGAVIAMDANGVAMPVDAELSANGIAVGQFYTVDTDVNNDSTIDFAAGDLVAKNDDEYIGKTITVMAVYDGEFVTTAEITVVDQAATIELVANEAEVGINTTLEAKVVDASGAKTSIGAMSDVKVIVLDKPENAVAVATAGNAPFALNANGNVEFNFLASAAGEYELQIVVVLADNTYVSGIVTVVVGGGVNAFDDVVVLSIGSNAMIVNDKVVALDVAPFVEAGRTMMQYTALSAFGIEFAWDEVTRSVTAEGNGVKVVMTIGEKVAIVNGEEVVMEVAPQIINGRTVVPVTYITNVFGIVPQCIYNADGTVADVLFTK